jgi:hypothetical protein
MAQGSTGGFAGGPDWAEHGRISCADADRSQRACHVVRSCSEATIWGYGVIIEHT